MPLEVDWTGMEMMMGLESVVELLTIERNRFRSQALMRKNKIEELQEEINSIVSCMSSILEGDTHRIGDAYEFVEKYMEDDDE